MNNYYNQQGNNYYNQQGNPYSNPPPQNYSSRQYNDQYDRTFIFNEEPEQVGYQAGLVNQN